MQNRFEYVFLCASEAGLTKDVQENPIDFLCFIALRELLMQEKMLPEIRRSAIQRIKVAYGNAAKDRSAASALIQNDAKKYERTEAARVAVYRAHRDGVTSAGEWKRLALELACAVDGIRLPELATDLAINREDGEHATD